MEKGLKMKDKGFVKITTNPQRRMGLESDYFLDQEIYSLTNSRAFNESVRLIYSSVFEKLIGTLLEMELEMDDE